jgi:sec-independent protein translocase protein TatA
MFDASPTHLLILLVVVLLLFGSRRLPGAAKSLGESMHIFKKSVHGQDEEGQPFDKAGTQGSAQPATAQPAAAPPPPALPAAAASYDGVSQQQLADLQRQVADLQRQNSGAQDSVPAGPASEASRSQQPF